MYRPTRNGLYAGLWRDLYQAAICEPDVNRLPDRIVAAEAALAVYAPELLCATGDDSEEGESIDDAIFILHALRNSLKHRPVGCAAEEIVSRKALLPTGT